MRNEANGTTSRTIEQERAQGEELDFSNFMDGLVVDVKGYVHAEKEHLTLHVTEKAARLVSQSIRQLTVVTLSGAALLFLSLALALYLSELLASIPLGFVIVAGAYLILLGAYQLWWSQGGRERSLLDHINDLNSDD